LVKGLQGFNVAVTPPNCSDDEKREIVREMIRIWNDKSLREEIRNL